MAKQPVVNQLLARHAVDVALRSQRDIAAVGSVIGAGGYGEARYRRGFFTRAVNDRAGIGQFDITSCRQRNAAGAGTHQLVGGQHQITVAGRQCIQRLIGEWVRCIQVRPGYQPVGRRRATAQRGGGGRAAETVAQTAEQIEITGSTQGERDRPAACVPGRHIPIGRQAHIARRTRLDAGTQLRCVAEACFHGGGVNHEVRHVGIHGCLRRRIQRAHVVVDLDRFNDGLACPADHRLSQVDSHVIACRARCTQHHLAAIHRGIAGRPAHRDLRAIFNIQRAGACIQLHLAALACRAIGLQAGAAVQRYIVTCSQLYLPAFAARGIYLAAHVQLACIHRQAELLRQRRVGCRNRHITLTHADIAQRVEFPCFQAGVQSRVISQGFGVLRVTALPCATDCAAFQGARHKHLTIHC